MLHALPQATQLSLDASCQFGVRASDLAVPHAAMLAIGSLPIRPRKLVVTEASWRARGCSPRWRRPEHATASQHPVDAEER
jgi:hypothetical protein